MKKSLFSIVFLLPALTLAAQNEPINVITPPDIQKIIDGAGQTSANDSIIPLQIQDILGATSDGNQTTQNIAPVPASRTYTPGKARVAFDVGYSYRTAQAAVGGEVGRFIDKMRGGIVYGLEITGFTSEYFGIGGRFTGHHYSNSEGSLSDNLNTFYFAPSILFRFFDLNYKGAFIIGMSLGYVSYK